MRAVICTRYGPPEVLRVAEVERPTPRRNQVCIRIVATAVTVSDCIVRGLKAPRRYRILFRLMAGWSAPRQPILGMVLAGDVESVGRSVRSFKEGDLLAMHCLRKAKLQPGQRVLVYGASGAIGTAAVQLARHFGAVVTGVCSTTNLQLVESLGAEMVLDYTREDFASRGERYDLILDAVGKRKSATAMRDAGRALTTGGRCISIDDDLPRPTHRDLPLLKQLAESGGLKPVIDRCYPLEEIVEAHRYVELGHKKGNVIVTVGPRS